jgi:hypothetical protein
LVETLDESILPYVIFLLVPVLGRMSDPDNPVRLAAANCFAQLIKLVPLEVSMHHRHMVITSLMTNGILGWYSRSTWLLRRFDQTA